MGCGESRCHVDDHLDAKSQLLSMKLQEDEDPETHLVEMKEYSQAVVQNHENFTEMASEIPDARINALVTSLQALAAHEEPIAIAKGKDKKKSKTEDEGMNAKSKINCHSCGKVGHKKHACYSIGGGKEAQAPWQTKRKGKDTQDNTEAVVTANHEGESSFASSHISEFANIAKETQVPRLKLGTYGESGAGRMSCPEPGRLAT